MAYDFQPRMFTDYFGDPVSAIGPLCVGLYVLVRRLSNEMTPST